MNRSLAVAVAVLLAAGAVAIVASTGAVADSHEIDSCTVIDDPGHYELADDVATDQEETCIDVRTDDVIVDGNGHTIEGPGPANDSADGQFVGVYVNGTTHDNYENVTVRNAEVTGFGTAIQTGSRGFGGPSATLENVLVRDNDDGIEHVGTYMTLSNVTIEENDGTAYLAGEAGLTDGTDVTIRNNGDGLTAYEAAVSLESSVISDNDDHGASVGPFVPLTLTDVEVSGNGDEGIVATATRANVTMYGGSITDNAGPGITVREAEAHLNDVTVAGNGEDGIRSLDGTVTVSNVTATDNADLELYSDEGDVSASEFHVGPSATTDFEGESISLEPVEREALPERDDGTAAGDGLNVSGDVEGPIDLELDVDTDDDTVDLWRHDGDWETVEEDLDAADGTVESTVDRNGTYAPGTEADDSDDSDEDDSDDSDDTDDSEDEDDSEDDSDEDDSDPSDQDGEKDKDTPTPTPSDQDGEKEKDDATPTPDESSDCGCPSSDDDADETDTASPSPTADGGATDSPSSDEQRGDGDDADASDDAVAQGTDEDDGTLGDGAGPGPVVALLALLGSALLARRRV